MRFAARARIRSSPIFSFSHSTWGPLLWSCRLMALHKGCPCRSARNTALVLLVPTAAILFLSMSWL